MKRYRDGYPVMEVEARRPGDKTRGTMLDIKAVNVPSRLLAVGGDGLQMFTTEEDGDAKKVIICRSSSGIDLSGTWRFHRGNNGAWKEPDFDDSDWEKVELPAFWEEHSDYSKENGYGWYRISGVIPESWKGSPVQLFAGVINDADVTYVNGHKVGSTRSNRTQRHYTVSGDIIRYGENNVIAIQVHNRRRKGGMKKGILELRPVFR